MARLLLVEDYPPLAKVVAIGLQRLGHEVERAGTLERAKQISGPFDLAILDLELPDGDGVELAGWLAEQGTTAQVVFFTASRDAALREAAEEFGTIVEKDDGSEKLGQRVTELLQLPAKRRAVGASEGSDGAVFTRKFSGLRRKVDS